MEHNCEFKKTMVELSNGDLYIADVCNVCKKYKLHDMVASISGWSLKIDGKEIELKQSGQVKPDLYRIHL